MAESSTSLLALDTGDERVAMATPLRAVDEFSPDLWEQHIREHGHHLLLSLLSLGLAIDKAEEIAQATWAKLLSQHKAGRLVQIDLPGLAITQARYLALDYLRREEGRTQSLDSTSHHPNLEAAASSDPERTTLARNQIEMAFEALSTCRPGAQRIFKLFYIDGESAASIAEHQGLSTQRVRQVLCEVRKVLRTATEEA